MNLVQKQVVFLGIVGSPFADIRCKFVHVYLIFMLLSSKILNKWQFMQKYPRHVDA